MTHVLPKNGIIKIKAYGISIEISLLRQVLNWGIFFLAFALIVASKEALSITNGTPITRGKVPMVDKGPINLLCLIPHWLLHSFPSPKYLLEVLVRAPVGACIHESSALVGLVEP